MLLIPLRETCKTTADVATLIDRLFADIRDRKELTKFQVADELKSGEGSALVDALILRPAFSGVGVDLKEFFKWFWGR